MNIEPRIEGSPVLAAPLDRRGLLRGAMVAAGGAVAAGALGIGAVRAQPSDRTAANLAATMDIYAAFGAGDVQRIISHLREDVEWEAGYPHNDDIPWLKSGVGHAAAMNFFQTVQGMAITRFEVLSILPSDEWVVALCAIEFTWTATGGQVVEVCEPHVWRFDENAMVRWMRHASDTRQHLAAYRG
jgi:hypothetical protein